MNNETFDKIFDYAKAICMNYSIVMNDDDYGYRGKIYQQGLWLEMLVILGTFYAVSSKEEAISRLQESIRMLEISYPTVEAMISGRIQANLIVIEILNTVENEEKKEKVPLKYRKIVRF